MKEKTSSVRWMGIAFIISASLLFLPLTYHLALAGLVSFQKEYAYHLNSADYYTLGFQDFAIYGF
jgi:hypothetical protein